jgi:hypothetical protein
MKNYLAVILLMGTVLAGCGSVAPSISQPPTAAPADTAAAPAAGSDMHPTDVLVASKMAGLLFNTETIQQKLDADTTAMAKTTLDTSTLFAGLPGGSGKLATHPELPLVQIDKVPQGFLDPLPESGAIPGRHTRPSAKQGLINHPDRDGHHPANRPGKPRRTH